jgi:glycosyltransferase involved in cell wall biosynthesis
VIFNSRSLKAVAESEGIVQPGRGVVLGAGSGNGIDVERFAADQLPRRDDARARFGLPADVKVIGFVGRFTKDKGIEDLVEAFASDLGPGDGSWLLLVGTFEPGDPVGIHVRALIETHPRIVVAHWLDHPGAAYRAMDVLAFPSYREGLPNVPLEAQLCGVPVVGYAATGTVDAIVDGVTGVLVPVGEAESLAEAITMLLADDSRRQRMGAAGRARSAGQFDRRALWQELADLYRRRIQSQIPDQGRGARPSGSSR